MKKHLWIIPVMLLSVTWFSCSRDNEEDLAGKNDCDTLAVSYAAHIAPIMVSGNCNGCHSSVSPSGGVITVDYPGLSVVAANGKLRGAVNHLQGYIAMPPSQPQLDSCSLNRINAWINQGFPNN